MVLFGDLKFCYWRIIFQADIENALNTVCDRLPAGFKTTCDNLIKEYFDEIINFLVHEMNPKVLCVQLHICPALVSWTEISILLLICNCLICSVDNMCCIQCEHIFETFVHEVNLSRRSRQSTNVKYASLPQGQLMIFSKSQTHRYALIHSFDVPIMKVLSDS